MKATIITTLIASLVLVGCRKDDDKPEPKVYPEENPLALYLQNSGFSQKTTNFINSGNYEFGYNFKPKVKGKINAITFKIPDNATDVRVTIWNATTKAVIRTIIIPSAVANTELKQDIDPLYVEAGTEYLISYRGDDWYKRYKSDDSNATYPIDAGNVSMTGYRWGSPATSSQTYPVNTSSKYYGGDLSIVFQQTE